MDFSLTEEQALLQKTACDFLAKSLSREVLKRMEESEAGHDLDLWQKMASLGWLGLPFPEEYGGSGGSFADLTVLLEEMGYRTCPGPYFSTVVLGGLPVLAFGTEEQKRQCLPAIAAGERVMTFALTEKDGGRDGGGIRVRAVPFGEAWRINGAKRFVTDARLADFFLCAVRTGKETKEADGITVYLIDGRTRGLRTRDMKAATGDRQYEVKFYQVPVRSEQVVGGLNKGAVVIEDTLRKAAVAKCAEMIGGARAVLDMTLAYAKERVQFGRPIGSFQAVQHHFADMWTDIHGSRYLYRKAALEIDSGAPAVQAVAMAKARTGEAYRRVTMLGHQIFGAIGFTMEHEMHRYHRRALGGDVMFGNGAFHRDKVAAAMGL
ncbi:MAG: acyl-CoA/acyl-ACP dehydrogenase [Syntrophaceae bacterium]|nr:acyl-CoA/acyl-ACP dehydrogenase [Syntrophaceae bacterium]